MEEGDVPNGNAAELAVMKDVLQLQIQAMTLMQAQNNPRTALAMKNVKVPEGKYDMSPAEFRMFSRDVTDYQH